MKTFYVFEAFRNDVISKFECFEKGKQMWNTFVPQISLSPSLSFPLSHSLIVIYEPTVTFTVPFFCFLRVYTYLLFLSLFLSLSVSLPVSVPVSLSLSHIHDQTNKLFHAVSYAYLRLSSSLSLSLPFSLSFILSLSLSLSHTLCSTRPRKSI